MDDLKCGHVRLYSHDWRGATEHTPCMICERDELKSKLGEAELARDDADAKLKAVNMSLVKAQSRLDASVRAHNEIFEALRECEEKRNAMSSRLDSAIEVRRHPGADYPYSLRGFSGACVGPTLSEALRTMAGLIDGYDPPSVIESADYQRIGAVERQSTESTLAERIESAAKSRSERPEWLKQAKSE